MQTCYYQRCLYKGIRFIDLPSTRIKGFEPFFHSFLCTIYCIIKRPDIVHIHNIGPGMFIPLLKLAGLKVVLTYHSANYEHKKWNYISRKILKFSEWIAVNGSTAVIFVNKKQMCLFNDKIQRKSTYIPNGVYRKQPATRTDYIEKLGLQPQKYILAVGRITQEKGFDYIQKKELELTQRAMEGLGALPYVHILGSKDPANHTGIVSFTIDGVHPHDVSEILSSDGIDVRAGHHCAQPLLEYLGVRSSTRASMMFYNTPEEIDALIESVSTIRRRMGYGE